MMGRFPLARGAASCLLGTTVLCGVAAILIEALDAPTEGFTLIGVIFLSLLWFFRDPDRAISSGWVAPADGKIIDITELGDGRTRVAIYLNVLNVHVIRSPAAGMVTAVEYRHGGRRFAFAKDSEHNERMIWHLQTAAGDVELVLIAGAFVRRIVPYLSEGNEVDRGGRIGLIRFGSRVDVYLPSGVPTRLTAGERTVAGVTRFDSDT
jgi:phosphatidylserine decarboxylase